MSDQNKSAFILDGYIVGSPMCSRYGVSCSPALKKSNDQKYIVKKIKIPQSRTQLDALLITGAYRDAASAKNYFRAQADDIVAEASFMKSISSRNGFSPFQSWQIVPEGDQLPGFEVYLLSTFRMSLEKKIEERSITHLDAVNMAIDICAALSTCRKEGMLYVDLKPSNIFFDEKLGYQIGDLGFTALNSLKYFYLPERCRSPYIAPEVSGDLAVVNETVDTYALGMILYRLFNDGELPEDPRSFPPPKNGDAQIQRIIMKACDPDPAKRWKDPSQMGQVLVLYMQRNTINQTPLLPELPASEPMIEQAVTAEPVMEVPEEVQSTPEEGIPSEAETAAEDSHAEEPQFDSAPLDEDSSDVPREEDDLSEPLDADVECPPPPMPEDPEPAVSEDVMDEEVLEPAEEAPDVFPAPPVTVSEEASVPDLSVNAPAASAAVQKPAKSQEVKQPSTSSFKPKKKYKRLKKFFSTLLILACLSVIGTAGFVYYQNEFLQEIQSLTLDGTPEQLVVTIQTDVEDSLLTVSCSDPYGSSVTQPVVDRTAIFENLTPGAMYTVKVQVNGLHKLVGQYSEIYTSPAATSITAFTAVPSSEAGAVVLNFTATGPEPDGWKLVYQASGEAAQELLFSGHTAALDGLAEDTEYQFRLETADGSTLIGDNVISYFFEKPILPQALAVRPVSEGELLVTWSAPAELPDTTWTVHCYSDDYDKTETTAQTEMQFTGLNTEKTYTVEVTAEGMTIGSKVIISANPISIIDPYFDSSDGSHLIVSWDHTGTAREGWLLSYTVDGIGTPVSIRTDIPFVSIAPVIPGARYHFSIQTSDNAYVSGGELDYQCPKAELFQAHRISSYGMGAELLATPETPDWSYADVTDKHSKEFAPGEDISMVLRAMANFRLEDAPTELMFVIRDADGNALLDFCRAETLNWSQMWSSKDYHFAELHIGSIPSTAGKYTVTLYMDGKQAVTAPFSIA